MILQVYYNTVFLIDSALYRRSCAAGCQHRFYKTLTTLKVYVRLAKQLSLLYDWHLLNVRQAKYLFSSMFVGRNSNCDVINALCPKAIITWKYFLMCFDNEINTTIYSKYSQTCLSELHHRNPRYPKQIARNRFLPTHFTPLIRKPCCPTPTRKFRNGCVIWIEKKTLNRITPTVT